MRTCYSPMSVVGSDLRAELDIWQEKIYTIKDFSAALPYAMEP